MTKRVTWKRNDFCTKGPFLSYSKTVIGNYLGKLPPSTALKCKPGMWWSGLSTQKRMGEALVELGWMITSPRDPENIHLAEAPGPLSPRFIFTFTKCCKGRHFESLTSKTEPPESAKKAKFGSSVYLTNTKQGKHSSRKPPKLIILQMCNEINVTVLIH